MAFQNSLGRSPPRWLLLGGALLLLAACHRDRSSWAKQRQACDYGNPRCPTGEVCTQVSEYGKASTSLCLPLAEEERPIAGPFEPGHRYWCSQGPSSPQGRSHSFGSDVFAADFASLPDEDSVAVLAPASGTAYVFDSCDERDETGAAHNVSHCGGGYGNHVKVWDGDSLFLIAHLSRVLIKSGPVVAGQKIGIEGASGAAGHRHVHLSISRMAPGEDQERVASTPGWKGSIPVRFRVALAGGQILRNDELTCQDLLVKATRYEQAAASPSAGQ